MLMGSVCRTMVTLERLRDSAYDQLKLGLVVDKTWRCFELYKFQT